MYHDQATAPFHSLYTEDGVVYTAGLPIIRTGADVTPSYSIAGVGEADETSFRHAVFLAVDAFRNRKNFDEAYENPLPKLYHEKRDESEKVRFSIPKKHSNAPFAPKVERGNGAPRQERNVAQKEVKAAPQQAETPIEPSTPSAE